MLHDGVGRSPPPPAGLNSSAIAALPSAHAADRTARPAPAAAAPRMPTNTSTIGNSNSNSSSSSRGSSTPTPSSSSRSTGSAPQPPYGTSATAAAAAAAAAMISTAHLSPSAAVGGPYQLEQRYLLRTTTADGGESAVQPQQQQQQQPPLHIPQPNTPPGVDDGVASEEEGSDSGSWSQTTSLTSSHYLLAIQRDLEALVHLQHQQLQDRNVLLPPPPPPPAQAAAAGGSLALRDIPTSSALLTMANDVTLRALEPAVVCGTATTPPAASLTRSIATADAAGSLLSPTAPHQPQLHSIDHAKQALLDEVDIAATEEATQPKAARHVQQQEQPHQRQAARQHHPRVRNGEAAAGAEGPPWQLAGYPVSRVLLPPPPPPPPAAAPLQEFNGVTAAASTPQSSRHPLQPRPHPTQLPQQQPAPPPPSSSPIPASLIEYQRYLMQLEHQQRQHREVLRRHRRAEKKHDGVQGGEKVRAETGTPLRQRLSGGNGAGSAGVSPYHAAVGGDGTDIHAGTLDDRRNRSPPLAMMMRAMREGRLEGRGVYDAMSSSISSSTATATAAAPTTHPYGRHSPTQRVPRHGAVASLPASVPRQHSRHSGCGGGAGRRVSASQERGCVSAPRHHSAHAVASASRSSPPFGSSSRSRHQSSPNGVSGQRSPVHQHRMSWTERQQQQQHLHLHEPPRAGSGSRRQTPQRQHLQHPWVSPSYHAERSTSRSARTRTSTQPRYGDATSALVASTPHDEHATWGVRAGAPSGMPKVRLTATAAAPAAAPSAQAAVAAAAMREAALQQAHADVMALTAGVARPLPTATTASAPLTTSGLSSCSPVEAFADALLMDVGGGGGGDGGPPPPAVPAAPQPQQQRESSSAVVGGTAAPPQPIVFSITPGGAVVTEATPVRSPGHDTGRGGVHGSSSSNRRAPPRDGDEDEMQGEAAQGGLRAATRMPAEATAPRSHPSPPHRHRGVDAHTSLRDSSRSASLHGQRPVVPYVELGRAHTRTAEAAHASRCAQPPLSLKVEPILVHGTAHAGLHGRVTRRRNHSAAATPMMTMTMTMLPNCEDDPQAQPAGQDGYTHHHGHLQREQQPGHQGGHRKYRYHLHRHHRRSVEGISSTVPEHGTGTPRSSRYRGCSSSSATHRRRRRKQQQQEQQHEEVSSASAHQPTARMDATREGQDRQRTASPSPGGHHVTADPHARGASRPAPLQRPAPSAAAVWHDVKLMWAPGPARQAPFAAVYRHSPHPTPASPLAAAAAAVARHIRSRVPEKSDGAVVVSREGHAPRQQTSPPPVIPFTTTTTPATASHHRHLYTQHQQQQQQQVLQVSLLPAPAGTPLLCMTDSLIGAALRDVLPVCRARQREVARDVARRRYQLPSAGTTSGITAASTPVQ